jgi:hypothetical protein
MFRPALWFSLISPRQGWRGTSSVCSSSCDNSGSPDNAMIMKLNGRLG